MTREQEISSIYEIMFRTFGTKENHVHSPNLTNENLITAGEVPLETLAYLQDMLATQITAKANITALNQVPVDYLVQHAKMEGAIETLRALLDFFHAARQYKLERSNPAIFKDYSEN